MPLLTSVREHHHPRGVVGFIVPWNYPLALGISDALPALVAGNGALIKPNAQTPFSALWAADVLAEAGLPDGLVQVVTGPGAELGSSIVDAVDFVMFTGSTAVGRTVAAQAGERLKECSMELGGKNAMIVLADADLDRTALGAMRATFTNAGQLCISMERLYVQTVIRDELVSKLVERTGALRLGGALDWSTDMGSLISQKQLDTVSVYEFETPEQAVELANDSPYGLNFSVWSRNTRAARTLAARLQAGTININEGYSAAWGSVDAPMGGFKESGFGRRHGEHGIHKYTESQTIAVQRLLPLSTPPTRDAERRARILVGMLRALRRLPWVR
jgi:succinate-semialdehyde dehydrogenase/glutarate-semialdehyde dehydrogenase